MIRQSLMITTAATVLTLATAVVPADASWINDFMNEDVARVRTMQPAGTDFRAQLAREYRALALYEADEMYDFPASDYFAKKALAVNSGQDEIPAVPQIWYIDDKYMNELVDGREKLTAAFEANAKTISPADAAVAQAKYDCWVEQMSEGTADSWQPKDIAACKQDFYNALDRVTSALLAAQPAPAKVAEAPVKPKMKYVPTNDSAVAYFDFDRSTITKAAQSEIEGFVARTSGDKNIVVTVKGYTDRSGTTEYNNVLSRKRADAVKEELTRLGLVVREPADLKTTAEGESNPAVETADGVRNALNRRAVITAYTLERMTPGDKRASLGAR